MRKVAEGLAPISVIGSNTLVVYSTVPGEVAQDGEGRNSPFAAALLARIKTPGLEVEQMFKRITADVLNATDGKQQPERLSRLQTEVVLLASQGDAATQSSQKPDEAAGVIPEKPVTPPLAHSSKETGTAAITPPKPPRPEFHGAEREEKLYVVAFNNKTSAVASQPWNAKGIPASDYSGYAGRLMKEYGPYFDIEVTEVAYTERTADLKDDCTGGSALKRLKSGDIVRMKPQNCTSTTVMQSPTRKVFFAPQASDGEAAATPEPRSGRQIEEDAVSRFRTQRGLSYVEKLDKSYSSEKPEACAADCGKSPTCGRATFWIKSNRCFLFMRGARTEDWSYKDSNAISFSFE